MDLLHRTASRMYFVTAVTSTGTTRRLALSPMMRTLPRCNNQLLHLSVVIILADADVDEAVEGTVVAVVADEAILARVDALVDRMILVFRVHRRTDALVPAVSVNKRKKSNGAISGE